MSGDDEDDVERSASGAPVLRHAERESDFAHPDHQAIHCEQIEAHLERHVGKVGSVFHEILSDLIHLDVLIVPPAEDRPYTLLVTSGVGDLPMTVPEGYEECRRCELMIALPPDWKISGRGAEEEANYWPIRWLKFVGRLPHRHKTWIGTGHTIPNEDPPEPIANTKFVGVMLTADYPLPDSFFQLDLESGEKILFYQLVPLYAEEMDLKLEKGSEEIEKRFRKQKTGFVLDPKRTNVALRKAGSADERVTAHVRP